MPQARLHSCIAFLLLALASIGFTGCGRGLGNLTGWASYDVAPDTLPAGWKVIRDEGSGMTMSVPPDWQPIDVLDPRQAAEFFRVAKSIAPQLANVPLKTNSQGIVPAGYALEESPDSIKPLVFTDMGMIHEDSGERVTLDKIETGLREKMPNIEQIDLPTGPALHVVRDDFARTPFGVRVPVKVVLYMLLHESQAYTVRFTTPASRYEAMQPVFLQIVRTLRITKPNAELEARRVTPPPPQASGVTGEVHMDPFAGSNAPPQSFAAPAVSADTNVQPEAAPGPGVNAETPGGQPSGDPNANPAPAPDPSKPGGAPADPNATSGGGQ